MNTSEDKRENKRKVLIDKEEYWVNPNEFVRIPDEQYCNLEILSDIEYVERIVALLKDLASIFSFGIEMDSQTQESFGGYFTKNLQEYMGLEKKQIYFSQFGAPTLEQAKTFVLCPQSIPGTKNLNWKIDHRSLFLNIASNQFSVFKKHFHWYIKSNQQLDYNNLLHLTMIVKNAGNSFREVLESYIPIIDRWTILDTGSTDNTIQNIKDILVPKVRGELYQEPFINFRESRNRCLDLAGKSCKFIIMLDDTYIVKNDIRGFLTHVRGDQFSESFAITIKSRDVEYGSNRIIKSVYNLRYIFKIHEVVQPNVTVMIPIDQYQVYIYDVVTPYMDQRTIERKKMDLKLLQESVEEDPEEPRHLYYIAQTYVGMKDDENAYKYFLRRVFHTEGGFDQEKYDAGFEAARIAHFRLKKPWDEFEFLYRMIEKIDPKRPEPWYFRGVHYLLKGEFPESFSYMRKAFEIGFPEYAQYSLKPSLSYYFCPKILAQNLCYPLKEFELGKKACELFLTANYPITEETPDERRIMGDWYRIYDKLCQLPKLPKVSDVKVSSKPYLTIVADGNWKEWSGETIEKEGLGGSETHTIELASVIQESGLYNVIVFCNCLNESYWKNVCYKPIREYFDFICVNYVHTSIISRYSEYIPATIHSNVDNIIVVVHDIHLTGQIIPIHPKIKQIICLTEWHRKKIIQGFPEFKDLCVVCHHGIYTQNFDLTKRSLGSRRPNFIYSSFPNRGLYILLEMWTNILLLFPNAVLNLYVDLDHQWFSEHFPEMKERIQTLLKPFLNKSVFYHGWVNKETLNQAWVDADIWLYPCIWEETFCLTALEAAASKTLAITTDLAALTETVGDRGIVVSGDPTQDEWKKQALLDLIKVLNNPTYYTDLVEKNYKWAVEHHWKNIPIFNYIQNTWEYRQLFNWTCDYPKGSKSLLTQILYKTLPQPKRLNRLDILDIKSHTGTCALGFKTLFPDCSLTLFDHFNRSIFKSFENNFKNVPTDTFRYFKLENPIIQLQEEFDLVHVNGIDWEKSSSMFEFFSILVSAWNVLKKEGLFILFVNKDNVDCLEEFFGRVVKPTGYVLYGAHLKDIQDSPTYIILKKQFSQTNFAYPIYEIM
jgi:hypothetical protein